MNLLRSQSELKKNAFKMAISLFPNVIDTLAPQLILFLQLGTRHPFALFLRSLTRSFVVLGRFHLSDKRTFSFVIRIHWHGAANKFWHFHEYALSQMASALKFILFRFSIRYNNLLFAGVIFIAAIDGNSIESKHSIPRVCVSTKIMNSHTI